MRKNYIRYKGFVVSRKKFQQNIELDPKLLCTRYLLPIQILFNLYNDRINFRNFSSFFRLTLISMTHHTCSIRGVMNHKNHFTIRIKYPINMI